MAVLPYKQDQAGKKQQVAKMFDNISHRYDFLNHFLSLGIDKGWRKKAINTLRAIRPKVILDVATGTGDFALQALSLNPEKVIGVDISEGMLEVGRKKIQKLGLSHIVELKGGDSENLGFEENKFDAVTVAFGVRNFENLEKGLTEIHRVLKSEGMIVVLEFSRPRAFPFKQVYSFYFKHILPKVGRLISKDSAAYTYLPESVEAFPDGEAFQNILTKVGFKDTTCRPLTFGISTIYTGRK
ncbi:bifunctional demethylmenaquinone methyltransferase/2-methoxy-6-polyprenyl-1,4-benzoquinol methylase UbiE [Chryseosolibacter indicus]|uniref:Demethylmenaquinone methyltransferase n=1 Tax=Chryseosolibacter indicus TaxID=2782351 RepID=A0ABS5VNS7_9BACT|nr:bifunctional demethylmenaquinone methyltransferase/2-methoxy-6-polyprenyl-1,4-benzoquinol methylase UbiE [Chryseosolibacter indicus]MBT1702791.1 bifunctional demethylmenaquinone methyltransferase/2-methoxy-6-polyprenyl-1,4-benzoquinol methylase UbiE [Chryseosolibacter indicus]